MPVEAFAANARGIDLSPRVAQSAVVIASPALAAETVVATSPALPSNVPIAAGVLVFAQLAYTIGTSGVSCRLRIRQGTGTSGTVIFDTGIMTGGHNTAGQLVSDDVTGFDTAPAAGQQYSVTLTIGSGAAASTVSAAVIIAIAI